MNATSVPNRMPLRSEAGGGERMRGEILDNTNNMSVKLGNSHKNLLKIAPDSWHNCDSSAFSVDLIRPDQNRI